MTAYYFSLFLFLETASVRLITRNRRNFISVSASVRLITRKKFLESSLTEAEI